MFSFISTFLYHIFHAQNALVYLLPYQPPVVCCTKQDVFNSTVAVLSFKFRCRALYVV